MLDKDHQAAGANRFVPKSNEHSEWLDHRAFRR